jgi:hypothetical protein
MSPSPRPSVRRRVPISSPGIWCSRPRPTLQPPRRCLLSEVRRGPPKIPPLPESFQHYRRQLRAQVYGAMGIALEDTAKHAAAVLRNWEFFRAPLVGIVCMHKDFGPAHAPSVGMYLQTLLLTLRERGLPSLSELGEDCRTQTSAGADCTRRRSCAPATWQRRSC